jgi:antitoxin component of RelBE/YafQ-DinJ toxin-antitoxin module
VNTKEKKTNKVTALLDNETAEKLKRICGRYGVTMSWVISRLISAADENQLPGTRGGGGQ